MAVNKNPEFRPGEAGGVTREAAEDAVRTLLRWAGEDPTREGLIDTPKRVVKAYGDWFSGYTSDPGDYLRRTFEEVEGYDEMVILRDISFESYCEHHMAPIIGRAHVGYLPTDRVVGISKLARVVDGFARRLQVQEKLTAQIAGCINDILQPRGVGVRAGQDQRHAGGGVGAQLAQRLTQRVIGPAGRHHHDRGAAAIADRLAGSQRTHAHAG